MGKITCPGCSDEMLECYRWQELGFDAGLHWGETWECDGEHCFVFALNHKGEFIVS